MTEATVKVDAGAGGGKSRSRLGCLVRIVSLFVCVMLVLLVAGVFVVRTEAGRHFIESRMSEALEMEVTVRVAHIALPYTLVLEELEGRTFGLGATGRLAAREVYLAPSLRAPPRLTVRGAELGLVREDQERWIPAAFQELGDLPAESLPALGEMTAELRRRCVLRVEDATIRWLTREGVEFASAQGVDFRITPVVLPERRMYHYFLSLIEAKGDERIAAQTLTREWLTGESGGEYLEIERTGPEVSAAAAAFWERGGKHADESARAPAAGAL